jgi:hypothetical protein
MANSAMRAAGDVARDFHIIGLVGQNEPGREIASQQAREHRRIGRIAADEPVRTELKQVAQTSDRNSARGRDQRSLFNSLGLFADENLINLVQPEAGDFDRRIGEDQFLELEFELIEIPLTFLAKPVHGEPQQALFLGGQMVDAHAGHTLQAQQLTSLKPNLAVDYDIVYAKQDRNTEPQRADCRGDFAHMGGIKLAEFAHRRAKLGERDIDDLQRWQNVVARRTGRSSVCHFRHCRPTSSALFAQERFERGSCRGAIAMFIHRGSCQ